MPTIDILIPGPFPTALLAQDCPHWRAIVIGPDAATAFSGDRIRSLPARGSTADLLNFGISESTADFLLLLDPADRLEPTALSSLLRSATQPDISGAIAGFRFTSPIGDLPIEPFAATYSSLPATLTLDHLVRLRPIASSVLFSRRALADSRLRTNLAVGTELDLLFRLAEQGHRFAFDPAPAVRRPMAPLAQFDTTLRDLAAHIRILADFTPPSELAAIASDLIDAVIVLRAHQRALADRGPSHLAAATRFPSLFAQWWHRCGLHGPAPRHILDANGGLAEAISTDPALIAKRILSLCPRSKPPILLGLGRNARAIARALHAAGTRVIGRDDSLSGPPVWAAEDNIPVEVIPSSTPFDPAATYIMTVLHDDGFLARLDKNLRIIRWRTMPDLILAEWRTAALDWALRGGAGAGTGLAEPKPALAGVAP